MTKIRSFLLVAAMAAASVATTASAATIPLGDNIGLGLGGFRAEDALGTNVVFTSATSLDFTPLDGGAGSFFISAATSGAFASAFPVASGPGIIKDLTFVGFSGPINDFWTITVGANTASFDLQTLTIDNQTAANITLTGKGLLKLTGYEDTLGTWSFSGNTNGSAQTGTFTWSADASPVPAPASLALLGLAMLGVARMRRRAA